VTGLWHFYVLGLVRGAATPGLGAIPVGAVFAATNVLGLVLRSRVRPRTVPTVV
jgi:hypothetical protein